MQSAIVTTKFSGCSFLLRNFYSNGLWKRSLIDGDLILKVTITASHLVTKWQTFFKHNYFSPHRILQTVTQETSPTLCDLHELWVEYRTIKISSLLFNDTTSVGFLCFLMGRWYQLSFPRVQLWTWMCVCLIVFCPAKLDVLRCPVARTPTGCLNKEPRGKSSYSEADNRWTVCH
jgi:hypothetical protein